MIDKTWYKRALRVVGIILGFAATNVVYCTENPGVCEGVQTVFQQLQEIN